MKRSALIVIAAAALAATAPLPECNAGHDRQ